VGLPDARIQEIDKAATKPLHSRESVDFAPKTLEI
jgi:hypothetical protein